MPSIRLTCSKCGNKYKNIGEDINRSGYDVYQCQSCGETRLVANPQTNRNLIKRFKTLTPGEIRKWKYNLNKELDMRARNHSDEFYITRHPTSLKDIMSLINTYNIPIEESIEKVKKAQDMEFNPLEFGLNDTPKITQETEDTSFKNKPIGVRQPVSDDLSFNMDDFFEPVKSAPKRESTRKPITEDNNENKT